MGTYSRWIQHLPLQEQHRYCSFLGVTCTKRQQIFPRRLGKAEAHPAAPRGHGAAPSSPITRPQLTLQSPAVPVPSWQAACAEGKGKERPF